MFNQSDPCEAKAVKYNIPQMDVSINYKEIQVTIFTWNVNI